MATAASAPGGALGAAARRARRTDHRRHARDRRGDLPLPGRDGASAAGYSRDHDTAQTLVGHCRVGVDGSAHQGNIGSAEDCRRTVQEVIDRHGRLDVLVNNAGILIDAPRCR